MFRAAAGLHGPSLLDIIPQMQTQPLRSGDLLPDHPDHTTALKVTTYGKVFDDADGKELTAGLHRNEIDVLQRGSRILSHLYRFAVVNNHIFHTRNLVTIEVECTDADPTE